MKREAQRLLLPAVLALLACGCSKRSIGNRLPSPPTDWYDCELPGGGDTIHGTLRGRDNRTSIRFDIGLGAGCFSKKLFRRMGCRIREFSEGRYGTRRYLYAVVDAATPNNHLGAGRNLCVTIHPNQNFWCKLSDDDDVDLLLETIVKHGPDLIYLSIARKQEADREER